MVEVMKSIHQAIRMNNLAVGQVEIEEYDEALQSMVGAMKLIKPYVSDVRERRESRPLAEDATRHETCPGGSEDMVVEAPCSSLGASTKETVKDQEARTSSVELTKETFSPQSVPSEGFVYLELIKIPTREIDASMACDDAQHAVVSRVTVALIFNLALVHHLHGIHRRSSTNIMRARTLYELALNAHQVSGEDVTILYTLAILNNLGVIYRSMGDLAEADAFFSALLQTLMYISSTDEADHIEAWDGLLCNAIGGNNMAPAA